MFRIFPNRIGSGAQVTLPPLSTAFVTTFHHVTQSVRFSNNPPHLIRTLGLHVSMLQNCYVSGLTSQSIYRRSGSQWPVPQNRISIITLEISIIQTLSEILKLRYLIQYLPDPELAQDSASSHDCTQPVVPLNSNCQIFTIVRSLQHSKTVTARSLRLYAACSTAEQ